MKIKNISNEFLKSLQIFLRSISLALLPGTTQGRCGWLWRVWWYLFCHWPIPGPSLRIRKGVTVCRDLPVFYKNKNGCDKFSLKPERLIYHSPGQRPGFWVSQKKKAMHAPLVLRTTGVLQRNIHGLIYAGRKNNFVVLRPGSQRKWNNRTTDLKI